MDRALERVSGTKVEVLVFAIGAQRYGLPAADVQELVRAVTVAPLPGAPAVVEGVINVRGRLVPVLDLRARFGLPPRAAAHTDHLVLARSGGRPVALRVDRALDLVRVEPDLVEDPAAVARGTALVAGVAKLPDGMLVIHDLHAFLSQAEALALDEALPPDRQA